MLNFSITLHVSSSSPIPARSSPLLPFYAATYSPPRNFSVTASSPPSSSSLSSSLVLLPPPSCFSRPACVSVGNMAELVRNAAGNGKDKPVVEHSRAFVEARSHEGEVPLEVTPE
ncbi:hypothetical protein MLD38_015534 [Melastoma candidum]|uniref:Uncharacterized protein n=1 Tax=Melastoma candidum TaxID=119954 RepID=A0ACB9RHS6_9MYRT|nr:hypothetical protein MLD38_015534 [Melastoma candidum]